MRIFPLIICTPGIVLRVKKVNRCCFPPLHLGYFMQKTFKLFLACGNRWFCPYQTSLDLRTRWKWNQTSLVMIVLLAVPFQHQILCCNGNHFYLDILTMYKGNWRRGVDPCWFYFLHNSFSGGILHVFVMGIPAFPAHSLGCRPPLLAVPV